MHRSLALFAAVLLASALHAQAYTTPETLQKLITFRDTMKKVGPHWQSALETWTCPTPANNSDSECDPCGKTWWGNWEHMSCRTINTTFRYDTVPGDGIVTILHFSQTGVEGPIPEAACPLGQYIKEFDFKVCHLEGQLPTWTPKCFPIIEEYDMTLNNLSGPIPPVIAEQQHMNQFKMAGNRLNGTLPPEFGRLPLLEWLRVFSNELTGPIPENYTALAPRLTQVSLGGNQFTGNLYPFAETQLLNTNVTFLPQMCGMVPVGMMFGSGFDLIGSPGLGLPCPDEVANGWPVPALDF